jgi:hypothetical protein
MQRARPTPARNQPVRLAELPGRELRRPGGFQEQRGGPVLARRTKRACDTETARRLCELSERAPGRRSPLGAASHTGRRELASDDCANSGRTPMRGPHRSKKMYYTQLGLV